MELLKKLTQIYAPSGNEHRIREFIESEIADFADEVFADNLGNLVVRKKGCGKKVMLAAHVDEIGVLVNFIDENGFLRFAPVGGLEPYCTLYQTVVFENGVTGVVSIEGEADLKKEADFSKMYIDIGASSRDEAKKMVSIGDSAVFEGNFKVQGQTFCSKAMDNRVGAYILISVLKEIKECKNDLYFVFTTQEELGLRGAKACSNAICPDIGLCVDVTDTGDTPNCKRMAVKLGDGPCIKYMDKSIITHKDVNDALKAAALKTGVNVQHEVLSFGGTDAGAIHTSGIGVKTGALSIPTRYIHTPCETVNFADVSGCIGIILEFLNNEF